MLTLAKVWIVDLFAGFRAIITHFQWSLLNNFPTEQGHCGACRRKWWLTDTDLCPCGETQTMSHVVESCPLTKLNGGLSRLLSADEDAVLWLTNCGSWHIREEESNIHRHVFTSAASKVATIADYRSAACVSGPLGMTRARVIHSLPRLWLGLHCIEAWVRKMGIFRRHTVVGLLESNNL